MLESVYEDIFIGNLNVEIDLSKLSECFIFWFVVIVLI